MQDAEAETQASGLAMQTQGLRDVKPVLVVVPAVQSE